MSIPLVDFDQNPETGDFESIDYVSLSPEEDQNITVPESLGGRSTERGLQRFSEVTLGFPGDVVQFARTLGEGKPAEGRNFLQRAIGSALEQLPTSEELRARSAEKRPELEPVSEEEELFDETVEDVAAIKNPLIKGPGIASTIGIVVAGQLAKQGIKAIGGEEKAQAAGKFGAQILASLFKKGRGVQTRIRNLYKNARNSIPEGELIQYPVKEAERLLTTLEKGVETPSKSAAIKPLKTIVEKAKNGTIEASEAVQLDQDLNELISKADKKTKGKLLQIKKINNHPLEEYGNKNKEFGDNYFEAKQAYQGIATSVDIQNFVKKNANLKNLAHAALFVGAEETLLPGSTALKLGSLGAGAASLYTYEIARRLNKNPALRRYYSNVITAALSENVPMLKRNLENLDRVAKKELQDDPLPLFDFEESEEVIE